MKPLPIGAAFLSIALLAVLLAIFWKGPPDEAPAERSFKPLEGSTSAKGDDRAVPLPPLPAGSGRINAAPPRNLTGLLENYLSGRRLETTAGSRDVDLTCRVPKGGSLFKVHAELSRAVNVWGGAIAMGEEKTLEKGQRALDLRITRRRESVRLRLLHEKEAPGECRIALVIDDFGFQEPGLVGQFLDLPISFTLAILPGYPQTASAVRLAQARGRSSILHLPMEPKEYPNENPGPGALFVRMDRSQNRVILEKDLRDCSAAAGVSNHMGSLACEDTRVVGADARRAERAGTLLPRQRHLRAVGVPAEAARRGVRCLTADLYPRRGGRSDPETMKRRLLEAREDRRVMRQCHHGRTRDAPRRFSSSWPRKIVSAHGVAARSRWATFCVDFCT